jgi:outer membrane murein-binding lipoprotein Lpp
MATEENETIKKKKGNFFTNLIFGPEETVDETSEDVISDEKISISNSGNATMPPIQNFNIPVTGDGVFDKNFNDLFQSLIVENNIQGIDYFEFSQSLKGMSGTAGLSEATSFQSVYNILKVGDPSLTKEKLLKAVDHYVGVLRNEETEFKSEMQASTEREVIARRQKVDSLNTENKDLVQQIQNLNEKIQKNNEDCVALSAEAANAEAKIGQTHKNFITTLAYVISNLETDKEKINQLIKE